jgi:clan AA aspartic protease (TIGR02281 family)
MGLGRISIAWAAMLLLPGAVLFAQGQEKTPEEVLKEKGLTKGGAAYLLEADAKLAEGLRRVRAAKAKVDDHAARRAAIEKKIQAAKDETARLEEEYRQVNDEFVRAKGRNAIENNRLVGRAAQLQSLMRDGERYLAEREKELAVLPDPRNEYISAVLEVSAKMEAAAARYPELAADDAVKGALAQLNAKAASKLRLGPSAPFAQELPLIRRQREAIDTGVVKLQVRGRVAFVNVTVNGKVTRPMLLDSGAAVVTLPWEVAKEAGALPSPKDPSTKFSMADGTEVEARVVRLASVQMGPYVVKDVECAVLPKSGKVDDCLLGGSFLKHFVYRMDLGGGEVHVSRVRPKDDGAVADVKASTKPTTRGQAGPATAAAPAGSQSALKELTAKLNDFGQWRDERGTWSVTPDGRLRGEGDSQVEFPLELPQELTVSWRMRLVKGLRARVIFEGTGAYFGTEGFDHTLAMYGGKDLTTERVKFEHGREYVVSMRLDKNSFECRMDGKLIATGKRSKSGPVTLRLVGGDGWSPGTTEFWGFELAVAAGPQGSGAGAATRPGTSIFDLPPTRERRGGAKK